MSVTFSIVGEPDHCEKGVGECDECYHQSLNMANANAREFIAVFGLGDELWGSMRASEMAKLIKGVLDSGYKDSGRPSEEHGRFIDCGRRSDYCNERAQQLLAMCERAGDLGIISWG